MINNIPLSPPPILSTRWLQFALLYAASWVLQPAAQAQSSWNAYNDFYLSPSVVEWGGATTPSATGNAWGYYAANVNGFGLPTQIGSYFTSSASGSGSQNMYQYSNEAPIGAGTSVGAPGYAATGGAGFGYYGDTFSWGSSLGRYENPWFGGAPGLSQGLSNLIWLQPAYLSNTNTAPNGPAEGIAPVLTWKAPSTGSYIISGRFVSGDQPANGASVAIVDSRGGTLLARTSLSNNTVNSFSYTNTYNGGDVVQFQVGSDFKTGNAVGLQVEVNAATSSGPTFETTYTAGTETNLGPNGLQNLMNYALGGTGPTSSPALPVLTSDGNSLTLTANIRNSGQGVAVLGQVAESLDGPWTDVTLTATGASSVVTDTTVKALSALVETNKPRKFLRLKATKE